MKKITITQKQADQFNLMLHALKIIHKGYMSPEQLRRQAPKQGLEYEESLEMAYENIQSTSARAYKGVRPIKPPTNK